MREVVSTQRKRMNMKLCLTSKLLQQAMSEYENIVLRLISMGVIIKSIDEACDAFTIAIVENELKYDTFE